MKTSSEDTADLELLTHGVLEIEGLLVEASNATLRAVIEHDGRTARCVYKPVKGEKPLWDFPTGTLAGREVAAFEVARAFGVPLVPPTILRDGPMGQGACQLWIEEDGEPLVGFVPAAEVPEGWHAVAAARGPDGEAYHLAHSGDPAVAMLAALDVVLNNADRKGAHVLHDGGGGVFGVDHGLSFHTEPKLRTVLWGWAGEPLTPEVTEAVERFTTADPEGFARYLTDEETAATFARAAKLLADGRFPELPADRAALPWPPI
ncbi:SCO1664 family protein [Phytomonospora sp. NPDC050363]|uniref:SCO1664 family protein n=1 Tax=Phytomonospora sp. NPDC050363 TaxID=3155642 RepID=UPI0033F56942